MVSNYAQRIAGKIKEGFGLIDEQGFLAFSRELLRYTFWELVGHFQLHHFVLPSVIQKTKQKCPKYMTLDDALDFVYSFSYFGPSIRPGQVRDEVKQLLTIVETNLPKCLLEIGTANGGTLSLFCHVASPGATIISIDLPGGKFGGGYPGWKTKIYEAFAKDEQKIHLIRRDSHQFDTLKEVSNVLKDRKLDFLFIDGDHTYHGVKKDFQMYSPIVRKGGIIAFHDIVEHTPESGCEVSRFWNEIKHSYSYLEIVKDWHQRMSGIGLLYV